VTHENESDRVRLEGWSVGARGDAFEVAVRLSVADTAALLHVERVLREAITTQEAGGVK
jgi:hypothetical protein